MIKRNLGISLAIAAAMLPPGTALADVKTGVDAWSRGDYTAAVREWQGPADKGDADAQFNLGQAYKLGRGVKLDLRKAEELFGKAAANGHLQASDMYGLLLFQRGERAKALPHVRAAADRGEPRAQYLLGVAYFNGDNVPKDWVRAYALASLAQQGGVDQAKVALTQMDQHIPLGQRQQAVALARELSSQAEATRTRQFASADLGATVPETASPAPTTTPARRPHSATAAAAADAASVARAAADNGPRHAGADYARPQAPVATRMPAPTPAPTPRAGSPAVATPRPAPVSAPVSAPAPSTGPWRVQLGAFSVAGNADALWRRVKDRPELAGRTRASAPAGKATKLFAAGFPSREAAQSACSRLTAAGFACLVTRD